MSVPVGERIEQAIERRTDVGAEIEREERAPPRGRRLRRTAFWLAVTGISLYLVAPSVLDTLDSWRDITRFSASWLAGMAALQAAAIVCLWALQRLTLHTRRWMPVIAS